MEPPTPDWNPLSTLQTETSDAERAALRRWKKSLQHLGASYGITITFFAIVGFMLIVYAVRYVRAFSLFTPGGIAPQSPQFHWSPLLIGTTAIGGLCLGALAICQWRALAAGQKVVAPHSRLPSFWGEALSKGAAKSRVAETSRLHPLSGNGDLLGSLVRGWLALTLFGAFFVVLPLAAALLSRRLRVAAEVVTSYQAGEVSATYSELVVRAQAYLSIAILAALATLWLAARITRILTVAKLNGWAASLTAQHGAIAAPLGQATRSQQLAMGLSVIPVVSFAGPFFYLYGIFHMAKALDRLEELVT